MNADLSILIPSRNEMFLKRTIEDLLGAIQGNTEIVVILDGAPAVPPLDANPRLKVVQHETSIGQRAACNEAARLATGKYVMKVDAHCAFDRGFDVKMMKEMHDNWTMVPTMRNLHAFDWVCPNGHRRYQSPSGPCKECGQPTVRDVVWIPKIKPQSNSYCFDSEPHFQYFNQFCRRPEYKEAEKTGLTETMSLQGSCFMMTKERYFALNICDESLGSWGSQGIEVAVKTWLSGGRVVVNHNTWYAHMFRTQGGDFSFPYPIGGRQVDYAKKAVRVMFFDNQWPLQVKPLSWLLEKFWPVPGWNQEDLEKLRIWPIQGKPLPMPDKPVHKPVKGVVYYTHKIFEPRLHEEVRKQLSKGMKEKHIISVSAEPLTFGTHNIVKPRIEGWIDLFERVLAGLEASTSEIVYLAEHDVLYHPTHFEFVPPRKDVFYYNVNIWKWRTSDGFCVRVDDCQQQSGLVAYRELLLQHYRERVRRVKSEGFTRGNGFEPGTRDIVHGGYDNNPAISFSSRFPNIDIRHGENATASRWKKEEFRNKKYTVGWKESHIGEIAGWEGLVI